MTTNCYVVNFHYSSISQRILFLSLHEHVTYTWLEKTHNNLIIKKSFSVGLQRAACQSRKSWKRPRSVKPHILRPSFFWVKTLRLECQPKNLLRLNPLELRREETTFLFKYIIKFSIYMHQEII